MNATNVPSGSVIYLSRKEQTVKNIALLSYEDTGVTYKVTPDSNSCEGCATYCGYKCSFDGISSEQPGIQTHEWYLQPAMNDRIRLCNEISVVKYQYFYYQPYLNVMEVLRQTAGMEEVIVDTDGAIAYEYT